MNWLSNFIPPRIRSFVSEQKEVPDNLWQKCPGCEAMLFHRDLTNNHNVCYHCGHHLRFSVKDRLAMMFDDGEYETLPLPKVDYDPLKFKDRKKYTDRIKEAQHKTGLKEAITIARGTMGGLPVVIAAFNFRYMGGSMSMVVGEAIVKAAETAVKDKAAFITIPASGGARMQEGMLSLMQMPRTIIAVEMVKEAQLPYIVILTDPTTGGVSASFAMVGDINVAEPGATIGFAGRRVIEETTGETLPDDFQTAEYLWDHGMVDMVVDRHDMKKTLVNVLSMLTKREATPDPDGSDDGDKKVPVVKKTDSDSTSSSSRAPSKEDSARASSANGEYSAARQAVTQAKAAQNAARLVRDAIEENKDDTTTTPIQAARG